MNLDGDACGNKQFGLREGGLVFLLAKRIMANSPLGSVLVLAPSVEILAVLRAE